MALHTKHVMVIWKCLSYQLAQSEVINVCVFVGIDVCICWALITF